MVSQPLVWVVDDDESVRESLPDLLREFGFAAQAFSTGEAFLTPDYVDQTRCLILDIAMPDMSGPKLRRQLARRRHPIPIVFITTQAEEAVREALPERGTAVCLLKPFSDTALLNARSTALGAR